MATQRAQGMLYYFSTGGKFRPGSNFTYLHTLTLATRSYVLLYYAMVTTVHEALQIVNTLVPSIP